MAFDYAGAKQAGYTDQEINQYLQGQNQSNQPQTSGVYNIVHPISNLLRNVGLGSVADVGGNLDTLMQTAVMNAQTDPTRRAQVANIPNPFMDPQRQQEYSTVPGALKNQLGDVAGIASWAIPGGESNNILSKLGLGAAKAGAWRASQPNATAGNIAGTAAIGGPANVLVQGLSSLLGNTLFGGQRLSGTRQAMNEAILNESKNLSGEGVNLSQSNFLNNTLDKLIKKGAGDSKYESTLLSHLDNLASNSNEEFLQKLVSKNAFLSKTYNTAAKTGADLADNDVKNEISKFLQDVIPGYKQLSQKYGADAAMQESIKKALPKIAGAGALAYIIHRLEFTLGTKGLSSLTK